MKTIYVAETIADSGRTGRVESPEGGLSLQLGTPGAETPHAITPEHLFGAAYAACFHGALMNAAETAHVSIPGTAVTARVALHEDDKGGYQLGVELRVAMPGVDEAKAHRLLHQAHQTCPYSKATRNNINVGLTLD